MVFKCYFIEQNIFGLIINWLLLGLAFLFIHGGYISFYS